MMMMDDDELLISLLAICINNNTNPPIDVNNKISPPPEKRKNETTASPSKRKRLQLLPLDSMDVLASSAYACNGVMNNIFSYLPKVELLQMTYVSEGFTTRILGHCIDFQRELLNVVTLYLLPIDAQQCRVKLDEMGFGGGTVIEEIDRKLRQSFNNKQLQELNRPRNIIELQSIGGGFNPSHYHLLRGCNGDQSATAVLGRRKETNIISKCISKEAVRVTLSMVRGETGEEEPRIEFTMGAQQVHSVCFNGGYYERMLSVSFGDGGIISLLGYEYAYQIELCVWNPLEDNAPKRFGWCCDKCGKDFPKYTECESHEMTCMSTS